MARVRVCAIVYSTYPFDPRVRREARELVRSGHEVDVIALRDPGEAREEVVDDVRVLRVPLERCRGSRLRYVYQYAVFGLFAFGRLAREFLRRKYDVVHVHSLPDFLVFVAVPFRALGVRIVLDLHESMPEILAARFHGSSESGSYRIVAFLESASCRAADAVITVNEAIRRLLEARGIPPSKVTVVTNAADPDVFPLEPPPWRPSGEIVIAGGINAERDFDTVLEAIAAMPPQVRYRLTIVGYGSGDYRAHVRTRIRNLGLGDWVDLRGFVNHAEVPALLERSEIGLVSYVDNPLTRIATPNKAYELAAMGRPLVMPRLPVLRDTFGSVALYYNPGNAMELAAILSDLRRNPDKVRALAEATRVISSSFHWSEMAVRLAAVYRGICYG